MTKSTNQIPAEHQAAIAIALHLNFGMVHDLEEMVLTIKRTPQPYSPWNSKIFGLNNINR